MFLNVILGLTGEKDLDIIRSHVLCRDSALKSPWSVLVDELGELEFETSVGVFASIPEVDISKSVDISGVDKVDSDVAVSELLHEVHAADVLGPEDKSFVKLASGVDESVLSAEFDREHDAVFSLVDVFDVVTLKFYVRIEKIFEKIFVLF